MIDMVSLGLTLLLNKVRTNAHRYCHLHTKRINILQGLGRRESFEHPSESSWFQAGPTKHGNRLQAGLAATGIRQLDWRGAGLGNDSSDEQFSTIHGIFTTGVSLNCKGLLCPWRTEKKSTKLRLSRMARHLTS